MEWNYNPLKGKIKEVCGTQEEFAKRMNLGNSSISQRLGSKVDFSQEEIMRSCEILGIPMMDLEKYFFTPNVANS